MSWRTLRYFVRQGWKPYEQIEGYVRVAPCTSRAAFVECIHTTAAIAIYCY